MLNWVSLQLANQDRRVGRVVAKEINFSFSWMKIHLGLKPSK